MLRTATLHLLASAADAAGRGDAPRPGDIVRDPLLRWAAVARARRMTQSARRLVDGADDVHALRLAFLDAVGVVPDAALDDRAAIQLEFESARRTIPALSRGWRGWRVTGLVVAVVICVVTAVVVTRPSARFDPRMDPLGASLSRALPHYVVTLGKREGRTPSTPAEIALARGAVLPAPVRQALGEEGATRLDSLLQSFDRAMTWTPELPSAAPGASSMTDVLTQNLAAQRAPIDAFLAAAGALDATFASRRLPYFVDADVVVGGTHLSPLLLSFYVEREDEAVSGEQHIRVLHLWRLDELNMSQAGTLGYTRPRTQAALVLLDQVESHLVQYLIPAAARGEEVEMIDVESLDDGEAWQRDFQRKAGTVVRRIYNAEGDPRVEKLGTLLARRRALIRRWTTQLGGLGMKLRPPQRLIPEADYGADLRVRIPRLELIEWDDLHETLLTPELEAAFLQLRDRYTASVERHEVQHRIDFARGFTPVPGPLAEILGMQNPMDAPEGGMAARARDEMSAHLAQLTRATPDLALDLLLLSRFLLDRTQWGSPYHVAALVILNELATELRTGVDGPLVTRGRVVRERVAKLALALIETPPEEIARAARGIWERLFGEPLAEVHEQVAVTRPVWRH